MTTDSTNPPATAKPVPRRGRGRILAAITVAAVAAAYLIAVDSTHGALDGGFVGWSGPVPGARWDFTDVANSEQVRLATNYSRVLAVVRPGGEVEFGFDLHNGGLIPVMVTGVILQTPLALHVLAGAGTFIGPGNRNQLTPFHSVTIGPGDTVSIALRERTVCDPIIRQDARQSPNSWQAQQTSPVLVTYRALGLTMVQTLSPGFPILVELRYKVCQ